MRRDDEEEDPMRDFTRNAMKNYTGSGHYLFE